MIEIIDKEKDIEEYFNVLDKRASLDSGAYIDTVKEIISNVVKNGDQALVEYTKKFDDKNFDISKIEISKEEQKRAFDNLDSNIKRILLRSKDRIYSYHEHQMRTTWTYQDSLGAVLGQKITPLERVGVYVPGGRASYPSSVLMNILPAKVAGVKEIIMVTPNSGGNINPLVLAAGYICEVDHIYAIGGAQAIAALAYGTKTIKKVDKIVGPGNIFVALAKKEVYGRCGIDSIAGPSEVCVIADKTANAKFVALDLMAQAEHDPIASSTLFVTDLEKAKEVKKEIEYYFENAKRKEILESSLTKTSKIIVVKNLDKAIEYTNRLAPEHLELALDDADSIIDKINNAGAIFVGHYSAESFGDYMAGPNHVLPTCGTARYFSPLGVDDFIKKSSIIKLDKNAALKLLDDVYEFANNESLEMHGLSAKIRGDF